MEAEEELDPWKLLEEAEAEELQLGLGDSSSDQYQLLVEEEDRTDRLHLEH